MKMHGISTSLAWLLARTRSHFYTWLARWLIIILVRASQLRELIGASKGVGTGRRD